MQSVKIGRCAFLISKLYSSQLGWGQVAGVSASVRRVTSAGSQPVVIRIPRRMQESIENIKQMQSKKFGKLPTVKPGRLLIKCKNPQLNQSVGYTLGKFEQPVLTSKGWKSNNTLGDYFSINSIQSAPPSVLKQKDEGDGSASVPQKTFNCFNICPELVETLHSQNIIHPTTVQMQTIPKILKGRNILCAAETGSGKTSGIPPSHHPQASSGQPEGALHRLREKHSRCGHRPITGTSRTSDICSSIDQQTLWARGQSRRRWERCG